MLEDGAEFVITGEDVLGDAARVSTTYKALAQDVKPGDRFFLKDGLIHLEVIRVESDQVFCQVLKGGLLSDHAGINLPGVPLHVSAVTPKDEDDLEFGVQNRVDYVAVSFVRSSGDVLRVKERLKKLGAETPVVAKIEKPEAVQNLADIVEVADGLMIARGDLGIEMPLESVPVLQKQILSVGNAARIPVIMATEMLESMVENPRPTRAEASDVANAVFDGSDALMLSQETAVGRYPVESLEMMCRIIETSEAHASVDRPVSVASAQGPVPFPDAVCSAASRIVKDVGAKAIVAVTRKGLTARYISKYRPAVPIYAYTASEEVRQRLALYWGIIPRKLRYSGSTEELTQEIQKEMLAERLVAIGDTVLFLSWSPMEKGGSTSLLRLQKIG
jgi:pyruvate kinase